MAKLHQKISECFRSEESAHAFCRVRSYLSSCRKKNVGAGEALVQLFSGKWPEFIQEKCSALLKVLNSYKQSLEADCEIVVWH